jgi:CheY-like chemotaxis protein
MDTTHVLYVEDDPRSRRLMQMLLEGRMGLPNVIIFEDSTNFPERVDALYPKPDIIFLDIHVDPYDGFEMLAILRQFAWSHDTPIVAVTASVMNEEIHKLKAAGFNGCLSKPLDMTTFPELFTRILSMEPIWGILHF